MGALWQNAFVLTWAGGRGADCNSHVKMHEDSGRRRAPFVPHLRGPWCRCWWPSHALGRSRGSRLDGVLALPRPPAAQPQKEGGGHHGGGGDAGGGDAAGVVRRALGRRRRMTSQARRSRARRSRARGRRWRERRGRAQRRRAQKKKWWTSRAPARRWTKRRSTGAKEVRENAAHGRTPAGVASARHCAHRSCKTPLKKNAARALQTLSAHKPLHVSADVCPNLSNGTKTSHSHKSVLRGAF